MAAAERLPAAVDDRDLALAAAAGDGDAFAAIYDRHADRAYGLLTRLVGPIDERDDLLQDAFIRLHRGLARFRGDAALSSFIYRVVVNVAMSHLQRVRRRPPAIAIDAVELIDPSSGPEHRAEQAAAMERVWAALARLRPKQRVAYVLREVMEMSYPEIGEVLEIRPAAARMRVNAASRALDKLLGGGS